MNESDDDKTECGGLKAETSKARFDALYKELTSPNVRRVADALFAASDDEIGKSYRPSESSNP